VEQRRGSQKDWWDKYIKEKIREKAVLRRGEGGKNKIRKKTIEVRK
jgi:hypothetical protein